MAIQLFITVWIMAWFASTAWARGRMPVGWSFVGGLSYLLPAALVEGVAWPLVVQAWYSYSYTDIAAEGGLPVALLVSVVGIAVGLVSCSVPHRVLARGQVVTAEHLLPSDLTAAYEGWLRLRDRDSAATLVKALESRRSAIAKRPAHYWEAMPEAQSLPEFERFFDSLRG